MVRLTVSLVAVLSLVACSEAGPAGPTGPTGPQGPQGPAGVAGKDGADAMLTAGAVTTTIIANGAVTAEKVSASSAAEGAVLTVKDGGAEWAALPTPPRAGAGLLEDGGVFAADPSVVQARVTGACAAGSSIRAVNADGTVVCQADMDTTYTAGSGLTLTGTTFTANTSVVQARIASICSSGTAMRTVNADGTVVCETIPTVSYSAGSGLTLSGSTFSADTSFVQRRVSGTCTVGSSIRAVNADGTVQCETDARFGAGRTGATPGLPSPSCITGEVRLFAGTTAPTGWSFADGSVLSSASFPSLAGVLGSLYGGNGTTTFALPDLRAVAPKSAGGTTPPVSYIICTNGFLIPPPPP